MTESAPRPQTEPVRVAVFFDGGFWFKLATYWHYGHPMRRRLSFGSIQDAFRWYAHTIFDRPINEIVIDQSHHFHNSRYPMPPKILNLLDHLRIKHHTFPPDPSQKQKATGLDVSLALTCWDAGQLDLVVLVTNSAYLRPLIDRLVADDVRVLIPTLDVKYVDSRSEKPRFLTTPSHLWEAATDTPSWDALISATLDEEYPLTTALLPEDIATPATASAHPHDHADAAAATDYAAVLTAMGSWRPWRTWWPFRGPNRTERYYRSLLRRLFGQKAR